MSSKPKLRLEIKTIKKCKQEELQKFECHIALKTSFYRSQRSWGKVIFSEACVKNSVHSGGACMAGGMHGRGACMAGGMRGRRGGMHGEGGACIAMGGMCGKGGVCGGGGMRGRYYEIRSMSGRYASYWNAFLLLFNNFLTVEKVTING